MLYAESFSLSIPVPKHSGQLSPTYSKDSTVIMRRSAIREIPTFLDCRITMCANPNWICILNEAAPSFQMLVETANVHVIVRLLSSCSGRAKTGKEAGAALLPAQKR